MKISKKDAEFIIRTVRQLVADARADEDESPLSYEAMRLGRTLRDLGVTLLTSEPIEVVD